MHSGSDNRVPANGSGSDGDRVDGGDGSDLASGSDSYLRDGGGGGGDGGGDGHPVDGGGGSGGGSGGDSDLGEGGGGSGLGGGGDGGLGDDLTVVNIRRFALFGKEDDLPLSPRHSPSFSVSLGGTFCQIGPPGEIR
jgi:hypothetical protein